MPNLIVFSMVLFFHNINVACGWQPLIQYPQITSNEYRVECMASVRPPGADIRLWLLSGVVHGPMKIGGEDFDITQETY